MELSLRSQVPWMFQVRKVWKQHYSCCADLNLAWLLQPKCPWSCSIYDFVNSKPHINPNPNPNADGTLELSLKVQMKKVWKD